MNFDLEKLSEEFLQIASHLRLGILFTVSENKTNLSTLSKKLDATASEMHRNLNRLMEANLIQKDSTGKYGLTTYGKMVLCQIRSWDFFLQNSRYFSKHHFGKLPETFIQSIGSLNDSKHIHGFVNIQDLTKKIYKNSKKYIYNILYEISYDEETLSILKSQLKQGIQIRTIFSKQAIIPEKRKKIIESDAIKDAIKTKNLERRVSETNVLVVMNENEGCVMFPKSDGDIDASEAFYAKNYSFHTWCKFYFQFCWENASAFYEKKFAS